MVKNKKLKMIMFDKGISQTELAEVTNIPRAYISLVIHGRYNFNIKEQQRIAIALDCDPHEIFGNQASEV